MLRSLLYRGIKIWQGRDYKITINLVLASEGLADITIRYMIYSIEHGSDYYIIEIVFNILVLVLKQEERLLFKNTPWNKINSRIINTLRDRPVGNIV